MCSLDSPGGAKLLGEEASSKMVECETGQTDVYSDKT